jgi:hypothetical protein
MCHRAVIVGADLQGMPLQSGTHAALEAQGLAWARHVKEPWQVMVMAGAYVIITVVLQVCALWSNRTRIYYPW